MTDFEKSLSEFRRQFLRGAADRLARIAAGLDRLESDGTDTIALSEVRLEFHKFSGLGTTYGFPEVTALGLEGERQCDRFLSSEGLVPTAAETGTWRLLLDRIRSELGGGPVESSGRDVLVPEAVPRVLLVGGDSDQVSFLSSVLESAGYETRSSTHADGLDSIVNAFRPDLLLWDVSEISSDAAGPVKSWKRLRPMVPVVWFAAADRRDQWEAAGCAEILVKPVAPGVLLSTVGQRISRARSNR